MPISMLKADADKQHDKLMSIHQELLRLTHQKNNTNTFIEALEAMLDFSSSHFYTEEQLMYYSGYPHVESHKKAHAKFSTNISALISDFVNDVPGAESDIIKFLDHWINQHLLVEDKMLEDFLELESKRGLQHEQES